MTRLIDANALKLSHCKECTLYPDKCMGKDCDWHAIIHINEMPTIDAIPIEFIQKRIDQLKEMNGRIFFANGGYTSPSDYEQWELERLIRDWRDSNE